MGAVEPSSEVEFADAGDELVVFIPVSEPPGLWLREYNGLARAAGVPAEVREEPRQVRLKVRVARNSEREAIFAALDTALELVEKAKMEAEASSVGSHDAQQHVKDWLAARRPHRFGAPS